MEGLIFSEELKRRRAGLVFECEVSLTAGFLGLPGVAWCS